MSTDGTLAAAATPFVAVALEFKLTRAARRHKRQRLGPDGCRELAERLLDRYPDEVLALLAARVGQAARRPSAPAEGAEDAEALSSQRATKKFNLRRQKSTSASSAPSALYVNKKI